MSCQTASRKEIIHRLAVDWQRDPVHLLFLFSFLSFLFLFLFLGWIGGKGVVIGEGRRRGDIPMGNDTATTTQAKGKECKSK